MQHGEELGEVMFFSSLTEDEAGELYATSLSGAVYKLQHLSPSKELKGFFRALGDFVKISWVVIDVYTDCKSVVVDNEMWVPDSFGVRNWSALCPAIG